MYKVTIGLEIHAELNTNTKCFSPALNTTNSSFNTAVHYVDLGFPGILPRLNKEAYFKALKTSIALNCDVPEILMFDRKNYYYPDLPKGYQITQFNKPIGLNGYINIIVDNKVKKITLQDIHLEEDTANLVHYSDCSLINYNRCGIPLIEIVTNPVMSSKEEAIIFLEELRKLLLYIEVSDAKLELGQMRVDVNISLSKDDTLGSKVEIKNINSFSNVGHAINYEILRQSRMLDRGMNIIQETRRFNDTTGETISLREKVEGVDYKYYVEPNIPKIRIDKSYIEYVKSSIGVLPSERFEIYTNNYKLSILEANILLKNKGVSDYFDKVCTYSKNYKLIYNIITGKLLEYTNELNVDIKDIYLTEQELSKIIKLLESNTISNKQAKDIIDLILNEKKSVEIIMKENNIELVNDNTKILDLVREVINDNIEVAKTYDPNRPRIVGFFIGVLMKRTKGSVDAKKADTLVREELQKVIDNM